MVTVTYGEGDSNARKPPCRKNQTPNSNCETRRSRQLFCSPQRPISTNSETVACRILRIRWLVWPCLRTGEFAVPKFGKQFLTHDVLENRPDISFDRLASVIGMPAAQIVQELTFIPDPLSDIPAHIQKQEYIRSFAKKSVGALVCKVADRVCNTADWLSTKPDYAPKYWKKATPLFEALMTRHLEVIDTFGDHVFPRMRYTIDNMNQMLV
jgi:hypothetical protein